MVTYNGDFFDCPFLETRAAKHGLDMPQVCARVCVCAVFVCMLVVCAWRRD